MVQKKSFSTGILAACMTVLVLFSCGPSEGDADPFGGRIHKGVLKKVKSLSIPLDSLTPFDVPSVNPCYRNDSLFLVLANSWANAVDIYHTSGLYSRMQPGEDKGLYNVIQTCSVRNPDSILVFFRFQLDKTKLIDLEGRVVDERVIENPQYAGFNHIHRVLWWKDYLFLLEGPLFDLKDMSRLANFQWEYRYDLRNDRAEAIGVTLPPAYVTRNLSNFWAILPFRDLMPARGMAVYNWPASADLELRKLSDFSIIKRVPAHIPKWGPVMLEDASNASSPNELEGVLAHVFYWAAMYDPWRKVIYRIATIPSRTWEGQKPEDFHAIGLNHTGIVVLNEEGDLLGYKKFPPRLYWPHGFVGKEGLYLSKANVYRDDFSEDYLEYDVFVFEPADDGLSAGESGAGGR